MTDDIEDTARTGSESNTDEGDELNSQSLRSSVSEEEDEDEGGEVTYYDEDGDDNMSVFSDMQTPTKPSNGLHSATPSPRRFSKIQEVLPTRFKEQWKRSGINLDKTVMSNSSNNQYLASNSLKVPELDETMQEAFQEFMEDAKLLEEIRKDVHRTHPDLYFFLEPTDDLGMRRYGALERILFVWSKLNKGVSCDLYMICQHIVSIANTFYSCCSFRCDMSKE